MESGYWPGRSNPAGFFRALNYPDLFSDLSGFVEDGETGRTVVGGFARNKTQLKIVEAKHFRKTEKLAVDKPDRRPVYFP